MTRPLQHPDEYVIGVDIGTGSLKGVLVTPDGTIVHTATRTHAPTRPRPGWVEMDALDGWWHLVASILAELVLSAGSTRIAGVCVSGLGPCLVVTGDDLTPLRPAILYGIDTRSGAEIGAITERFGEASILARCGKNLTSQAIGPKLAWIRDHEPEVWRATRRWYSSQNYVVAQLTGEWVIDHHTASQCDPLYDIRRQDWAYDWAGELFPELALPRLVWPSDIVGVINAQASDMTGLPVGTPVVAGTVDAWAEAFSVGVRRPGDLMLMYGSTMFMVQVLPAPAVYPGLWTTSGVEASSHTLAAGMATSGSVTRWFQELTGGVDFEQLVREAASVRPGAEGLIVLPYFAGERSPIFDPDARGLILGLTLSHGREHITRAIYEGVGYGLRQNLEMLDDVVGPPARVVAVGGGTNGGLWPQIVSDICRTTQVIPAITTGASYGDALLAAIGVGLTDKNTDWTVVERIVEPNAENASVYDDLYAIFREIYPATQTSMHQLAAVQRQESVQSTTLSK